MSDLFTMITSENIIIVCVILGIAIALCLMIYFVEKNTAKRRMKHNTRELNKLVEKIKEEIPEEKETYEASPVMIEPIVLEESSISEVIDNTVTASIEEVVDSNVVSSIEEDIKVEEPVIIEEIDSKKEKLEYTTIEPDQETAKLELKKIAEELKKETSMEDTQNISLTNYEEQQEENAIISLEELVRKSKKMYESNEITQYADEGNEPISLQEYALKVGMDSVPSYEEPFIISNVVPEEEVVEEVETKMEEVTSTIKGFQSSPIISPIYGIESNELALENTANYEKLDKEIKRTNEFLMSLKELQGESK